jgi:polar amino acid transport system substrate-binding protein
MPDKIKVAVSNFPPLVIKSDGKYSGFEVDLWKALAKEINVEYEFRSSELLEQISDLENKKIDVAFSGISLTEEREKKVDFSYATLDSGLLILVKKNSINFLSSIRNFFREGHKMMASVILGVVLFIFAMGNFLWLVERSAPTFSKNYFPGIFESFWLVVSSMSTAGFGDFVPHTWAGRILTTLIIVMGVAIFGILVAQISSFLTVMKFKGEISSHKDLKGKKIATKENSAGVEITENLGAKVMTMPEIEDAYDKLEKEDVDAVVYDAPALIYFVENDKKYANKFNIIEDLFYKHKYAIALQSGSSLREPINRALLKLRESGIYDALYKKWFGEETEME